MNDSATTRYLFFVFFLDQFLNITIAVFSLFILLLSEHIHFAPFDTLNLSSDVFLFALLILNHTVSILSFAVSKSRLLSLLLAYRNLNCGFPLGRRASFLFFHSISKLDSGETMPVCSSKSQTASQSLIRFKWVIALAGCTPAPAGMVKLRVRLSARTFLATWEISNIDLSDTLLTLFLRCSFEVPRQTVDSSHFVLGVSFELVVVLIALVMVQSRVSAAISYLLTLEHDAFGAEAPLHSKLLSLAFD